MNLGPIGSAVQPLRFVFLVTCVIALTSGAGATNPPGLEEVLARAGTYVQQFERDFALVISDEDYRQEESFDSERMVDPNDALRPYRVGRRLDVHAETLFLWLAQDRAWMSVRSPLKVGSEFVADSKDRLERAVRDESPGQLTRLRQIARESVRFNLGSYRDNNTPTLALQFLDPEVRPRFAFTLASRERVNGVDAVRVTFRERQRPTVMQSDGDDLFSTGSLWIATDDAVVLKTLLTWQVPARRDRAGSNGSVLVEYRRDPTLAMWVPAKMEEQLRQVGGINDALHCTATYSRFRRLDTSVRIVP
jgi:hypothetical protein